MFARRREGILHMVLTNKITTTLYDATLKLLKDRSRSVVLKQISRDTGLTHSWLTLLCSGALENPSVNKIQTLYEYLSNSKLELK